MQNFNVAPYFDDFSDDKNFYKMLFVPARPVQTRELNQIQSILQNQIKSHADHVFKNGSMVIPGHVYYDPAIYSIKLVKLYNDVSADLILDNLLGKTLVGEETGVTALVVHYDLSTSKDDPIVYVKFISSSTTEEEVKQFKNGEVLYDSENAATKLKLVSSNAIVAASIVTVNEGIYYVNGYFVRVAKQTITLEKFSNKPTWRAGLEFKETIVTAVEDDTLYDNALGYSNYAAPGANRYKIDLVLSKRSFNFNDQETTDEEGNVLEEKFIDLIQVKNGQIIQEVTATEYSELEKIFARRTYDESGDYEVTPFEVTSHEYRNNVRGIWRTSIAYLEGDMVSSNGSWWEALNDGISGPTAPAEAIGYKMNDGNINWVMMNGIPTGAANGGIYQLPLNSSLTSIREYADKFVYKVKPGKGYVSGYEVETKEEKTLTTTKALTYEHVENEIIPTAAGTYARVTNLRGLPNISSYELMDLFYFTRAELLTFDTNKRQATATNAQTGAMTTITITDMGYGYDRNNPPSVNVTGGGGSGAILKAVVSLTGEIQEIRVISGGTLYNGSQNIVIDAPAADPIKIGTCRVRSMDYEEGTIGSASAKYRLQIFDVDLEPEYTWGVHVKSIIGQGASGFQADLVEELVRLPGLVSITSGQKTVTGIGTSFLSNVTSGQYVRIGSGLTIKTSWVTPTSDSTLTVPYNFATTLASQTIDAVYSSIYSVSASLLTPFTKEYVRNVRSADDTTIATTYTVRRHFNTVNPTAGVITLTLNVDGETFAPVASGNYIVSVISSGAILTAPSMSLSPDAKTLTISGLANEAHEILTTVEKTSTAAREKSKTRAIRFLDITNKKDLEKAVLQLNEADVYRVIKIMKANGAGTLAGNDYQDWATATATAGFSNVTRHFILDNGQTPMFYGLGKLSKKKGGPLLNNTVRVVFEYFNHSAGDYFTVNSYVDVARDKIDTILRDSIDFRPRIADTGTSFDLNDGASITEPTSLNTFFKVNYSYYLPRVDLVTIDSNNKLEVVTGEAGFSLKEPIPKSNSMIVGLARLAPGTFRVSTSEVEVSKKEHKRYTMADIGKLERRINNLEYYAQLSLLEKDTIDKNITDANGFDRFKAGILTDAFTSQAVSDSSHPDFMCSIDFEQGECRAFAETTNIDLKETALTSSQRAASNYTDTGDILSLPYTNVICIEQPLASRSEFVNPFAVVTFNGDMQLFPSQDTWMEERIASTVTVNREGNFNTVLASLESNGQLGTRWNSWQTNWAGITFNMNQNNAWTREWGNRWLDGEGFRSRVTGMLQAGNIPTSNQFLTGHLGIGVTNFGDTGQVGTVNAVGSRARTGTSTQLNESWSRTIDDRVVETTIVPTIRTRPIIVRASGLRPNTKVTPFFSDIDVSEYCHGLGEFIVDGAITGTFITYEQGVVDDEDNPARSIPPGLVAEQSKSVVAQLRGIFYDRGDVVRIFNGTVDTGATAIVVDVIDQDRNGVSEKAIKFVGRKNGTGWNWDNIPTNLTGYNIKSASGNAYCNFKQIRGPGLVTNSTGSTYMVFYIPNNTTHRFNTGTRVFKVTDDKTNNDALATTTAIGNYVASGILEVKSRTITNVRNAGDIVTRNVAQTDQINQTLFIAGRGDPLAQTFSVTEKGGALITQAEVYFVAKDPTLPIRCEIRDVVNGYPGPNVLSRASLNPSKVNVDATKLVPTVFTFPQPVYLPPVVEYCLVLLSDSTVYKVWISRMGEEIVGTNRLITSQPSLGSLFKSQNNSTWTAEQFDDLTFRLYKAKFDITKKATIEFANKRLPFVSLSDNPFYAVSGTNKVRVFHPHHGFVDNDTVVINGAYVGPSGAFAALGTTYLAGNSPDDMKSYIVRDVEYDFYTISITDAAGVAVDAAYTTQFGGAEVEASYQIAYSTLFPNFQVQVFPETKATLTVKPMKGDPVNAYNFLTDFETPNRENIHFTSMMLVASHENESKRIAKNKSLKMVVTFESSDENLSPVIDSQRCSAILINNKINDPTLEDLNYPEFDDVTLCTNSTVSFLRVSTGTLDCNSYFETTDDTLFDDFDKITVGKNVTATSGINNNFTFKVLRTTKLLVGATETYRVYVDGTTNFVSGTDTACTLVLHTRYIDEIAPYNGSALSTYVSQAMRTTVAGTGVRVTLDANIPTGTMIEVYHRHIVANSLIPLHEICWHPLEATQPILTTADFNTMTEYTFEHTGLSAHDVSQLKVVFKSTNPALTPRISALRMISLA